MCNSASRSRRSTALTDAGRRLLDDARTLLASAAAVQQRVRRETATLTVGFMPGLTVTAAVRALTGRHPDLTVEVVRTTWDDQVEVLHDGRVDVGLVRLPIERRELVVRPLFTEPRVVLLPAEHPLAGKESVRVNDLAADHLLQDPDAVPEWRDIALELREGIAAPVPAFASIEEKLEHVASGSGISVIPLSAAEYYRRPDVVVVPVEDIGPNQVCVAWAAANRSPWVEEFAAVIPGAG